MKLEVRDIRKSFGEKEVLRGISFSAQSGAALGLLGRNGAGKTTTIRIIMDVFPADAGQVLLDGRPLRETGVSVGYLPEERGLYPKKLISDQMIYLGELKGLSRRAAREQAYALCERLGMQEHWGRRLDMLSKGNQQKIQLAATLLGDPDIVILDEPFSGLDPVNAQLLKDLVSEQVARGKIVIFSSHQMSYVEQFCHSIAIMNHGDMVLSGDLRQIKRSYPRDLARVSVPDEAALAPLMACLQSEPARPFVASAEKADYAATVRLTSPDARRGLVALLVEQKIDFESFEILEPSLERIFVEKAGEAE